MNTELFRRVHEVISVHPERLDMGSWEGYTPCGTTRCVAGWAVYLTIGTELFDAEGRDHVRMEELSLELGVPLLGQEGDIARVHLGRVGAKLLGLSPEEATALFHSNEEVASDFVALAAQGREGEAREVLRDYLEVSG